MPVQDGTTTRIIMPGRTIFLKNEFPRRESSPKKKEKTSHSLNDFSFGVVYANDLAKSEMEKEKPNFPVGSIIIREKNATETSETPEIVIAMVKREKDFSKKTGDWEFLVFNGADLKLQSRETKSDCSKCHKQAEKSDWVFRDYLK
jgi:hypothetical protein